MVEYRRIKWNRILAENLRAYLLKFNVFPGRMLACKPGIQSSVPFESQSGFRINFLSSHKNEPKRKFSGKTLTTG